MSMKELVHQAIIAAVASHEQPRAIAERLIAWIESAPDSSREADEEDAFQRLNAILQHMTLREDADDGVAE